MLAEGLATPEDIDAGMKLGNQPIGPLALADMVGLTCLAVMDVYPQEFGDSKYRACPLLRNMSPPAAWAARPGAASTSTDAGYSAGAREKGVAGAVQSLQNPALVLRHGEKAAVSWAMASRWLG